MAQDDINFEVKAGLNKIKEALLHPERHPGHAQPRCPACRPSAYAHKLVPCESHRPPPLPTHQRTSAMLTLLVAIKTYELELLKEIESDTEALAAAKAHYGEVPL